jgi:glycosyltransferase involved in cell wall biosynthesis
MDTPEFREATATGPSGSELPEAVRQRVYVVLAAFNEAACIAEVVRGVRTLYPHVVVVDDGSSDQTSRQALAAGATVLRHLLNRGQGAALQTGITYALSYGADFVVTFDSDGQHRVEDIARLIAPIHRGEVEITLGSRFLGRAVNIPPARRLLLKLAVWFTRIVSGVQITDTHNGLRGFSRRAAEGIRITLDRMAHASELIDQVQASGLPYREIPVSIHYTAYSRAKGQSAFGAVKILVQYLFGRVT